MNIGLDRLRVFLAVQRAGSVLGAARVLAVTPSAVSQSVKRLEQELGVRLFQRIGNRLEATPEEEPSGDGGEAPGEGPAGVEGMTAREDWESTPDLPDGDVPADPSGPFGP